VIHTELALAAWPQWTRPANATSRNALGRQGGREAGRRAGKGAKALDGLHPVRALDLSPEEMELLRPLFLLTAKPALYIANVEEHGFRTTRSSRR
jgi:ribosome-binding ATPase YchF (GTP1/OBG family)